MRGAFRSPASVLALLLLPACDDPLDPCAEFGCGVEGVDLALVEAEIEWTADQGIDDRVGGRLVQPGDDLTFRYRVLNRGTMTSQPTVLELGTYVGSNNFSQPLGLRSIDIPALAPGEDVAGRMTLDAPMTAGLRSDEMLAGFWIDGIYGYYFDPSEADRSNNQREYRYHLATGYASMSLYSIEYDTLHVGESDSVWVRVVNRSPVAPLEGDLHIAFCALVRYPGRAEAGCGETGFGVQSIADLGAARVQNHKLALTLPSDALPIEDFGAIGMRVCLFDEETPLSGADLVWQMSQGVCANHAMPVVQDLDVACSPPVVSLPATLDASALASDCEREFSTYDVWAFDVTSSGVHSLVPVAGTLDQVRVFGQGHERIAVNSSGEFFLPEPGRYHVVVLPSIAPPVFQLE